MGSLKVPDTITTDSERETRRTGKALSGILSRGDVVSLEGELGSGKTQVVKGIAEGLGIDPEKMVCSPTFTIVNIYEGRVRLYHVDLYRLGEEYDELEQTGIFDAVGGDGIAAIEWGDKVKKYLPKNSIRIILKILSENQREITVLRGFSP